MAQLFPFRIPGTLWIAPGAAARLPDEVRRLGGRRVLVVTEGGLTATPIPERIMDLVREAGAEASLYDQVKPEPTLEHLEQCLEVLRTGEYDLVVVVGGGSPIDVGKAAAAIASGPAPRECLGIDRIPARSLPCIALPTTAGTGAEVTANAIFTDTDRQLKVAMVSPHIIPSVAIVDAELTLSCPPSITAATGMDALVHAIESYTAGKATPVTDLYAAEGIRRIAGSLRTAVHRGSALTARAEMALGSCLAGISLANAGVGAVHALAYPLGGRYGIPHGVANSLLLPHVMAYNVLADLPRFSQVANWLGEPTDGLGMRAAALGVVDALRRLAEDIGIPPRMSAFGVTADAIPGMAQQAHENRRLMDNNPRRLTQHEVHAIYAAAL